MPHNFFTLPAEIRNQIYRNLFTSKHDGTRVTPDVEGSRRQNGLTDGLLNLHDSLPLLRTCQYIHEEATSILYGDNVFTFDDRPHGVKENKINGFNLTLPWCDYVTILRWMSNIGSSNRTKICHLRFVFTTGKYIPCPEEPTIVRGPVYPTGGGANGICDALELLSHNHNLCTLDICFGHRGLFDKVDHFCEMFAITHPYPRKLVTRLGLFKGIKEIRTLLLTKEDFEKENEKGDQEEEEEEEENGKGEDWGSIYFRHYQRARSKFEPLRAQMEAANPKMREAKRFGTRYGFINEPKDQRGS